MLFSCLFQIGIVVDIPPIIWIKFIGKITLFNVLREKEGFIDVNKRGVPRYINNADNSSISIGFIYVVNIKVD